MESQPVRFMHEILPNALRAAAGKLAAFLGASRDDLVFVENATAGANAVLGSLKLAPGDEILVTSHGYGAVRNAARHACRSAGATLVEVPLPCPVDGPDEIVAAVRRRLGPRTVLAVFDAITSPSALIMPLAALIEAARDAGARTLVDGAHAPGQIAFDLPSIGADWIVGNAHKWLFAPKGCGFLWAAGERRDGLHPPVISHGLDEGFTAEFDWVGTRDPSAWLAVESAIEFYARMGGESLRRHNDALAAEAVRILGEAGHGPAAAPDAMRAAMATVRLAERLQRSGTTPEAAEALHDRLWRDHRIEVPIVSFQEALWVRVSAQIYNEPDDYRKLAAALAG